MFIHLDLNQYQIVADTKTPLLQFIGKNLRVKNGYACTIEPNHRKVFSNLDFKKLLVNKNSRNSVNLPTETGGFVPFAGDRKSFSDFEISKVKQLINMDLYYPQPSKPTTFLGIL